MSVVTATHQELTLTIPATGTLLPAEFANIVPELSRRLLKVHAKEGTFVKRGTVLFQLDSSELVAELETLRVQESLAKKTADRAQKLVAERVGTEAEAEVAVAKVDEIAAQKRALAVTLDKTTIRAPFDGVLGLRRVSEGAWVTPSTVLVSIADTTRLKIDLTVPERYAASLSVGATFRVEVTGSGVPLAGTIIATEPSVDAASRSVLVRGLVTPPDAPGDTPAKPGSKTGSAADHATALRPGTFAKVSLPVTVHDAVLVPAIALTPSAAGQVLYVEKDGRAERRVVEIGARTPSHVQVLSGLLPGERVITTNLLRLKDGAPVTAKATDEVGENGSAPSAAVPNEAARGPSGAALGAAAPNAGAPTKNSPPPNTASAE